MIVNRKNVYFECNQGWHKYINAILDEIEEHITYDISIVQIKEKYGTLRIYYQLEDIDTMEKLDEIDSLIQAYEILSGHICELCGEFDTAKLRKRSGWFKTLCDTCAEKENWRD